ncbi:hypothetical protein [Sanguibacter sp. 25GB23B1]|uniref:hypothetical protein n=1 Tax=unclassified Sanguibacter TaxID=2645534 RepID=UPI0032AEFEA6
MIAYQSLGDLLLGRTVRDKLQQGWSPQCERHPAADDRWGVLKTTAIQAGAFSSDENKELPSELVPRPALEVREGDLLLTCAGPRSRCGVPALVRSTQARRMLSGKMYRFRPTAAIDPRYLEAYLLSPGAQKLINAMKTGISDSGLNLTKDRFLGLPVPVFPLSEQVRIVDILEEHFSRLDAADRLLDRIARQTQALLRGRLDAIVWHVGAPTTTVSALLRESMRNGHSAAAVRSGPGIRTLTLTAVTRNKFDNEFTKITSADPARVRDLWLRPGDVLVQRSNTPELVGTTAMYTGPADWAIFPDLLIRLRADTDAVLPGYLTLALRTERAHRNLRAKAKGLAGSMPKIDQSAIGSTLLPVPGISEQRATLIEAQGAIDVSERLDLASRSARVRSTSLRRALLAAAFSGRLTGRSSDLDLAEELAFA